MNKFQLLAKPAQGTSRVPRVLRGFGKSLAVTACALSLGLLGCSDLGKKSTPKVVTNPDDGKDPGVKDVVSSLDSLMRANKGTGKGVITGFLTGEGKSIAQSLFKQAGNAAGERRLLTRAEIPLTGATVLIFNAEKPTTLADTTLKTDSTGTYTAMLPEGKYFGFAVYLDLETFQLVTTQIPNMNPIKDSIVKMDTAVAIEDLTAPTVVGVYDAAAANDDGVFLVGSVPDKNAKINITFSEPMNRESAKGVIIGKVDNSASTTSLVLDDTLKAVTQTWSGDSKELTLNVASLSAGAQYGIIIPVSLKDLAKNPLEAAYKATFVPVAAAEIEAVPFAAASTFPEDQGSLKPIQNPGLSFNRPVEVFSMVKSARISPAVTGFWEVNGARAMFVHKNPLEVGKTYTISLPDSIKDLAGHKLGKAFSYSFTVKDFEGAAKDATGANQSIALEVEAMFDAYLQGDLGRFAAAFHANFRLFEGDGSILSKTQFLDMIRSDVAEERALRAGMPAPVFDVDSAACKDHIQRWKVGAHGNPSTWLWVEAFTPPGSSPRVWDRERKEVDRSRIAWDRNGPRFTYDGKTYGFAPDFSKFGGGVNMDVAREDHRFMGDVMAKTSTILLEPVTMSRKEEFKVDGGMAVSGDTARLAVKMSGKETMSRTNFEPGRGCDEVETTHEHYEILKFLLVHDGSRWMVLSIVSPKEEINRENFEKAVDMRDFGQGNIQPILLAAPVNGRDNAADADGKVTFRFNGPRHDSIGGYIVGLAEDPKFTGGRPPFGALLFVKATKKDGSEESFVLNSAGGPVSDNATKVLRRVHDLRLPGWERTLFEFAIGRLHNPDSGFAGVYQWKVIAVNDTSAAQFLANGFNPSRFHGESDFGPNRGYFAVKGFPNSQFMARMDTLNYVAPPMVGPGMPGGPMGFGDMDMDGVPDFMEQKYGSDPRDRNSYPDFRVDTDGDRMCDYLEGKLDPTGKDSLAYKPADEAALKAQVAALAGLAPPILIEDADRDGFPDDVEQMLGFNPRDPFHNPGTRIRAKAPVGVFSGKVQMGASTNSLSFKLYQDSSRNLMVAFTAYFGMDTVKDTSRVHFNDMMGEVLMALPLPKDGPDSGRALLLRGHYEAIRSLMMGGVEIIPAPASKAATDFGGGPFVGNFAASSRGEDVSMYLPGGMGGMPTPGSMAGPGMGAGMGPMPGPMMGPAYRTPPPGTSEGARFVLEGGRIILIDDFGDTLAVIGNVNWRGQPDGSFELFAEERIIIRDGMKRNEVGGRLAYGAEGWILDGHFMQSKDSAGNHRDIPGQLCAKASKEDLKPVAGGVGMAGALKGWIAQDKLGAGFAGPVVPSCNPGMPCYGGAMPSPTDPGYMPPPTGPGYVPPSTGPGYTPPPTGPGYMPPAPSFAVPYMGGPGKVRALLEAGSGVTPQGYFHVSVNGRVYRVKYDSLGLAWSKSPMCGWTAVLPELAPLKEGAGPIEISGRNADSMSLGSYATHSLIVLIEDQFAPGMPARLEKTRDSQGNILVNVLVAEMRPKPFDYGRMGDCGSMDGFPPGGMMPPAGTQPPSGGSFPPMGGKVFFTATLEVLKPVLFRTGNVVLLRRDSVDPGSRQALDPASLAQDMMSRRVHARLAGTDLKVVFLGADGGMSLLYGAGDLPVVTFPDPDFVPNTVPTYPNPDGAKPTDTVHAGGIYSPLGGTPVPIATPVILFNQGSLDFLRGELGMRGNAGMQFKDGGFPVGRVSLDPASLSSDSLKKIVRVKEAGGMGRHFAVLADSLPGRLLIRDGAVGVFEVAPPMGVHEPVGGTPFPVGVFPPPDSTLPSPTGMTQPLSGDVLGQGA